MIQWIILLILLYLFIGLHYYSIVYLCYISELDNEYNLNKIELFIFCSLFWIILLPGTIIYNLYQKYLKGEK